MSQIFKGYIMLSVEFILVLKGSFVYLLEVGPFLQVIGAKRHQVFEHEEHTYSHTVLLAKLLTQLKTTISLEEMKNVAYGICQSIFSPLNY